MFLYGMFLHDNICAEVFTEVFMGLSSNIHSQGLVFLYVLVYYKLSLT